MTLSNNELSRIGLFEFSSRMFLIADEMLTGFAMFDEVSVSEVLAKSNVAGIQDCE